MSRLLRAERLKNRGRHVLLTALALTAVGCVWAFYSDYKGEAGDFAIKNGYYMYLYQLPMVCAIIFPLICMLVSSRLAELEHSRGSLRLMCVMAERGALYDAKLIYGLAPVLLCVLLFWGAAIVSGLACGFAGAPPMREYALFLLFTLAPTTAIYMLQHALSMAIPNQTAALCVGALGEFAGVFSLFLPQLPWLRRLCPWGWYGALQFVGLFGWTKETRYQNAYFADMGHDWACFAGVIAAVLVFYLVGRAAFCRKEL